MSFRNTHLIFNLLKPRNHPNFRLGNQRALFRKKKKYRELCPNKTCKPPESEKVSFWDIINRKPIKKPAFDRCRIEQSKCVPDPDLSQFDGIPYKTCGTAYAIQRENLPKKAFVLSREDRLLIGIEANLDRKHDYLDTMPEFTTVEKRLIDLNDRKLHPFYKMHQGISSKLLLELPRSLSDAAIGFSDGLPKTFTYNAKVLGQKNIHFHYKRTEPPDQLTKHLLELRRKQKPEPPPEPEPEIASPLVGRPRRTYDSLYQENFEF